MSWLRVRFLVPLTSLASATCRRCCRSTLAPINTCDFFHGPFEILDKRTSLFQLISVGRSRCNDERGIRFVNQYGGERVYQLDAKELGLNDIKDSVSEYFNHLIFAPILNNVYMRALSAVTHKDYMTRRYMWKLDY